MFLNWHSYSKTYIIKIEKIAFKMRIILAVMVDEAEVIVVASG